MRSYKLNPEKYYGVWARYKSMRRLVTNLSKITKLKDVKNLNEYLIRLDIDTLHSKLLRIMYEA